MAELKTKKNDADVGAFLDGIENEKRRADCRAVVELLAAATGEPPAMWGDSIIGFGSYHYRYPTGREGDWMAAGVSPRKRNLTVYVMTGFERHEALMKKLGRYTTGKLRLPRFRGQVNAWVPIMTGPRMDGFACESSTRKALWTCGNLAASVQAPAAAIAREISNGLWAPAAPICDAARRPAGVHRPGRSTAPPASGRSADAASRRSSASRRRRRAVRPCAIMPSPCFRQQRR